MAYRFRAICAALTLAVAGATPTAAHAQFWQCVTYARQATGVAIRGNANTWWSQAAGRYSRGQSPQAGAIMAFKSIPGMRAGHVAVVKTIVSAREVLLDHANWSRPGKVEHNVRAVDVSPNGDWSQVRVFFAAIGGLGTRINPTFGFIYPGAGGAAKPRGPLIGGDLLKLAMLER